jgi:hypothetical protein
LYVLGMLPEDEASKIEQLAKLFPEIQEELDRISEALQGFAATSSVAPSPSVKQDLMAKFREMKLAEESEDSERVVPLYKEEKGSDVNMAPVVPLPTRKVQLPFWAAASLIGFVLSLGALIYLFSENKKSRTELAEARQQVDTLQNRFSQQQQEMTAYSQTLQMMQNGEYKKIELSSLPGKTAAQAQVMWNTKTHEVFLADVSLPAPPTGKQYQLWAIVDGKPVDAGLMSDVKHVAQKMKTFDRADAFAISIENKGGNPTPTEVYMMGKV